MSVVQYIWFRCFYQFCRLLKFVHIIQFLFHIIDAFSHRKSSHNLCYFFRTLSDGKWHAMTFIIIIIFSEWNETVKLPGGSSLSGWPADFENASGYPCLSVIFLQSSLTVLMFLQGWESFKVLIYHYFLCKQYVNGLEPKRLKLANFEEVKTPRAHKEKSYCLKDLYLSFTIPTFALSL